MPQGKYFSIQSRLNELVMEVSGGEAAEGAEVVMMNAKEEGENDCQIWISDPLTKTIRTKLDPEYCLEINGKCYRFYSAEMSSWFVWYIFDDKSFHLHVHNLPHIFSYHHFIVTLCSFNQGDNVLVINPFSKEANQRWKLAGDRIQKFTDSSIVLDVANNNTEPEATVCAWEFHGDQNQLWDFLFLWVDTRSLSDVWFSTCLA